MKMAGCCWYHKPKHRRPSWLKPCMQACRRQHPLPSGSASQPLGHTLFPGSRAPIEPQWAGMLPEPDWLPYCQHGTGRNPMNHIQMEAPTLPRNRVRQRKSEITSCDQQLSITLLPSVRNTGCCLLHQLLDRVTTKQGLCCPEQRGRW